MPLVFNGVTIPENVANVLYFNGVNITDVFFNGVQVWNQSLFDAQWSGNSLCNVSGILYGISVSGSLYRYQGNNSSAVQDYAPWLTATGAGLAVGTSSLMGTAGYARAIVTTETTMRHTLTSYSTVGTVAFSIENGFSGTSGYSGELTSLNTSGGLVRFEKSGILGSWISLT